MHPVDRLCRSREDELVVHVKRGVRVAGEVSIGEGVEHAGVAGPADFRLGGFVDDVVVDEEHAGCETCLCGFSVSQFGTQGLHGFEGVEVVGLMVTFVVVHGAVFDVGCA